jgi:hypothetical protein
MCRLLHWNGEERIGTSVNMLLDLFYLTIGIGSLGLCWLFVKACDRL